MAKKIINQGFSTPRNGAKTAKIEIDVSTGNLVFSSLPAGDPQLASGTMQYLEGQEKPIMSVASGKGQTDLSLRAANLGPKWSLLPWKACMGATNWTVNIHPEVIADIRAHSGGGNLQLDLEGMTLQKVSAETGGGNVDLSLPSDMDDFQVLAKSGGGNVKVKIGDRANGTSKVEVGSGAGNVTVTIPRNIAARIHAASGLGKVLIDSRFEKIGDKKYQSPDFEKAASKMEITVQSGAGNVEVC